MIQIIKYPWLFGKGFYIMTLFDKKRYFLYKTYIRKKNCIIKKVRLYDDCIKMEYTRGYNPFERMKYYIDDRQVGIIQANQNWLI